LTPSPAQGGLHGCVQWDLSRARPWTLEQQNDITVSVRFSQNGSALSGNATWQAETGGGDSGTVQGTVDGNHVAFTAQWSKTPAKKYEGRINDEGGMHDNTTSGVAWISVAAKADCVEKQIEDNPPVPIGDVTNPATPPPYEPLPPGGTGNFLNKM